ncbi:helix-turn-helix domain-containing protein [Microbacterium sp. No. 7]|uniref:helix-turn-helix domain-containing protein n=1 Tax=Microbacterium sp. No. 7 TaxID=1714373 RepID=UPI0006D21A6B|nr:XRE family transcriptional regulator [Microbacterium sp. No. 7]ALJ22268.1 XRE family transcriptional regulator [Microbacterium sp. No. 7]
MALDTPDPAQLSLGAEIRRRRRAQGLTLQRLAARADLSHPFLSQLERGLARPSMLTLERIAQALETTQVDLLLAAYPADDGEAEPPRTPPGAYVIPGDRGARIPQSDGVDADGYSRLLVRGKAAFFPQEIIQRRDEFGPYYVHPQDEWIFVIAGDVEVDLGDDHVVRLRSGDSLYYAGGTPHRRRVTNGGVARLLIVQAAADD